MHISIKKDQYCEEIQEGIFSKRTVRYRRFRLSLQVVLTGVERQVAEKYGWSEKKIPVEISDLEQYSRLEDAPNTSAIKLLGFENLLEGVRFVSGSILPLTKIEKDARELAQVVYHYMVAKATFRGEEVLAVGEEESVQAALHAALSSDDSAKK